jgi:site-specific DNA-cytosine methylase
VTGKTDSWCVTGGVTTDRYQPRPVTDPAPCITAEGNTYVGPKAAFDDKNVLDAVRITLREALILQSFKPDYPVQGTKTKRFEQVGNAVPVLLAQAVLGALVGEA